MSMEINKHIIDNLDYYLSLPSPEYAFLLCGEWGVGKTYFIDEYIKNKSTESFKLIKVSLFGLKKISDIDSNIFQKLHPILGSKYAQFAGNVIKGALSLGVKLDINSDGVSESTISTKFDKFDISEFLTDKKTKEIVLVFDDLERCQISNVEVLGFINGLVENSKIKVILIANEKSLIAGSDGTTYKDFKEKVIGKTFEIKHDFGSILCDFLKGYSLDEYKDVIQDVYNRSNLKNLRKFKQSIDDFEYLIKSIDDEYKSNSQSYKDLVRCFFALSVEIKKGSLSEEDLCNNAPFKQKSDDKTSSNDIYVKYFNNQARLYNGDVWARMLFKGELDRINDETSKLALFVKVTNIEKPDWVKLWNFRELENNEFLIMIERLECEMTGLIEEDLRVYLHKIALLIYFSKNSLASICIDDIKELVKNYIEKYRQSSSWKSNLVSGNSFHNATGYGYFNDHDQDFSELRTLIVNENEKTYNEELQKKIEGKGDEIIESIKSGLDENFMGLLLNTYEFEPILHKVEPKTFVDALIQSKNSTISKVNEVILERYSENHYLNNRKKYLYLLSELGFWKGVSIELNNTQLSQDRLKSHILNLFLNYTVLDTIKLLSDND